MLFISGVEGLYRFFRDVIYLVPDVRLGYRSEAITDNIEGIFLRYSLSIVGLVIIGLGSGLITRVLQLVYGCI